MSSKHIWWHIPRLRRDAEEDKHRTATPLDLFFDLIFVAIIAVLAHQLAHHMETHPGWHSFVEFFLLFIPVWWFWIGNTYYNERFGTNDVSQRLFTFIQMIPAAGLAYFAHEGLDPEATKGYAISYALARILIIFLWARGAWHNREAWPMIKGYVSGFSLSVILFIISVFVDPPFRYVLWGIGLAIDLLTPMINIKAQKSLPKPSHEHLEERFNLFTIIVLGETVAAVVAGASKSQLLTLPTALAGVLGLFIASAFWFLYFDQVMKAIRKDGPGSRLLWTYGHLPLVMGLTILGSGVLAVVGHADVHVEDPIRWLIAGGSAMAIFSIWLIELSTKGYVDGMDSYLDLRILRVVSALGCIAIGLFGHGMNAIWVLGIVLAIVAFQAIFGMARWIQAVKKKDDPGSHGWSI